MIEHMEKETKSGQSRSSEEGTRTGDGREALNSMLSGVLFHEDSKCLLEGGLKSRLTPKGGGFRHTNSFLVFGCTTSSILLIYYLLKLLNLISYNYLKNMLFIIMMFMTVLPYYQALDGQSTGMIQEAKAATCQS